MINVDEEGQISLKEHQFTQSWQVFKNGPTGPDLNYRIPERYGRFEAYTESTSKDLISYEQKPLKILSYEQVEDFDEQFGVSKIQKEKLLKTIKPRYVVDFADAHLQGASELSLEYTTLIVEFKICRNDVAFEDWEYKPKTNFNGVECASEDEIFEFFTENQIFVFFMQGANYIDFQD